MKRLNILLVLLSLTIFSFAQNKHVTTTDLKRVNGTSLIRNGTDTNIVIISSGGSSLNELHYFNVVDFGADTTFATDATSAIQAAINAAHAAHGGVVYFPKGHYKIAGSLIKSLDGVNPNCQLYIPLTQISDTMLTIKLLGEFPPNISSEGVSTIPRAKMSGVILESTIQGDETLPSVIGTSWYLTVSTGYRNYIKLDMENMIVRTSTVVDGVDVAGTMSAINASRFIQFNADNIKTDISSIFTNAVRHTNETYALLLPDVNNKAELNIGKMMNEGYRYGSTIEEHTHILHHIAIGCEYAIKVNNGFHSSLIDKATYEENRNSILLDGTQNLIITDYGTEHFTVSGYWFDYQKDIAYLSGNSNVRIFSSNVVESNIGQSNTFISDIDYPKLRVFNGAGENVIYANPPADTTTYLTWTSKSENISEYKNGLQNFSADNSFGNTAKSVETLSAGQRFSFKVSQTDNHQRILGTTLGALGYASTIHSLYLLEGGSVHILENGATDLGEKTTATATDLLAIFYNGSSIEYQKWDGSAWVTFYTSTVAASGSYYISVDMNNTITGTNGYFENAKITN